LYPAIHKFGLKPDAHFFSWRQDIEIRYTLIKHRTLARHIQSSPRPADRIPKQTTMEPTLSTTPDVSVIIAAYNVAPYIERAIRSALTQDGVSVEVIVVDDGSTDNTVEVVERIAAPEVRTQRLSANGGPGAARNAAIEAARGDWIAVLDGDDAFLAGRLAHCLRSARSAKAQVVIDDLLVVDEDGANPRPMFGWQKRAPLDPLTPEAFITGNSNFVSGHTLGYVKPLVERRFIIERGVRYPTGLRIGEDYLFLLELLVRGATCHVEPTPGYAYTARVGSTSHRLTQADVKRIQHSDAEFMKHHRLDPAAMAAQHSREANLLEALDYKELVEQIKHGKLLAALLSIVTRPMAARHLWQPVKKRLARLL
jgi:succinoglycan biosynthesis protein ExoO